MLRLSKSHRYQTFIIGCLLLLPLSNAFSAIHSCRLADGTVTFQDSPCAVIPVKADKPKARVAKVPLGMAKSWFDKPSVVPDRAICTKSGCHCDMYSRKFKSGLPLAIADALYLDGSWHRLDSSLLMLELGENTLSATDRIDLQKERDEAACNILMSQQILRLYGKEVLRELRNKQRYAEDRGLDDPADCDAGDTLVCTHTEAIDLYSRIRADIKALTNQSRIATDDESLATSENEQ